MLIIDIRRLSLTFVLFLCPYYHHHSVVLSVVQQGVQAEFEARFERLLEPLLLAVRFDGEVDRATRSDIFSRFVNITPAMDLPYVSVCMLWQVLFFFNTIV
jgi:hypothetical protein